MANKDFIVKNGITVNTNFSANSTNFNYANKFIVNSSLTYVTSNPLTVNSNTTFNQRVSVSANLTVNSTLITNNFNMTGSFTDGNNSVGTSGQVLLSNGSSVYWSDTAGLIIANNNLSGTFYFPMSNSPAGGLWTSASIVPSKISFDATTGTLNSTTFNSISDASKKTNVKSIESPLKIINNLRGVSFIWKDNNLPSLGVIAQEVEKVLPELIHENDEKIKSVNYNGLIAVLIESIKVLEEKVKNLENYK